MTIPVYEKYNSDTISLDILETLTKNLDFSIPNVDFSDPSLNIPESVSDAWSGKIPKIDTEDLTTRRVNGAGVFDAIMASIKNHLMEEYDKGRITGAEYTKVYQGLTSVALQSAVQFLLQKDKAYWDALQAQVNALTTNVNLNTAKVQLAIAQAQAHKNKAEYALTVLKLATENAQFGSVREQFETLRAQTMDTRTDGTKIVGTVGKQKDLYTQQIDSYIKDAQYKAAKIFSDAWISQKTIDEGLVAPAALQNSSVDTILKSIKANNKL